MSDAAADALDAVRRDAAAARGLDEAALPFIGGTTVDEIETSASRFVTLIGKRDSTEREQAEPSARDLFAGAARAQAVRKRALVETLLGRAEQPRGEDGRWGSFDGGARESLPPPPPSHDEWLSEVLRSRRADVGARL